MGFRDYIFNKKALNRDPSFELLRIYATLLVILRHTIVFAYWSLERTDPGYKSVKFLHSLTSVCNNLFVTISGYFSCTRKMPLSRLLPIIIQNYVYSAGLYLFGMIFGWSQAHDWPMYNFFFPLTYGIFWFTLPFIISQIFFNAVYDGLKKLGRNFHRLCIIGMFLIATQATVGLGKEVSIWRDGTCINTFFYFLIVGSYIRFYDVKPSLILCIVCIIVFSTMHFYGTIEYFTPYLTENSLIDLMLKSTMTYCPLSAITTVFIFLAFRYVKISNQSVFGKIINILSEYNYGVYNAHIHPIICRQIFFNFITKKYFWPHKKDSHIYLYVLENVVMIYVCSVLLDFVRSVIFNLTIFRSRIYKAICNRIDSIFSLDSSNPVAKNNTKEEKMEIENEGKREDEMYLNPLENNVNIEIEKIDDISTLQEDDEMNKYSEIEKKEI